MFPNGILLWLQSRLCTSGKKKPFALINRINVLLSQNIIRTEMLWSQYSHFYRQVPALNPAFLACERRIQPLPLEGSLLLHHLRFILTTVRQLM